MRYRFLLVIGCCMVWGFGARAQGTDGRTPDPESREKPRHFAVYTSPPLFFVSGGALAYEHWLTGTTSVSANLKYFPTETDFPVGSSRRFRAELRPYWYGSTGRIAPYASPFVAVQVADGSTPQYAVGATYGVGWFTTKIAFKIGLGAEWYWSTGYPQCNAAPGSLGEGARIVGQLAGCAKSGIGLKGDFQLGYVF